MPNEGKGTSEITVKTSFELQRFKRNAYFYGKLMTVRDFELEQEYFNEKRFMGNRLVHGQGVVCGLEVESVSFGSGAAADKLVVTVSAGVALDGCGRELVADRALNGEELEVPGISALSGTKKYYLYLKYKETFGEPVPALADASGCDETCCHSRIFEGFKLLLSDEWPCDEVEDSGGVMPCPSGEDAGVLLTVLDITKNGEIKQVSVNQSETEKCRRLVYNNPLLYELYSGQQALLNQHLNDFDNPHRVKHAQTGPAGWDQAEAAGDGAVRSKHLSTEDAGKWNGAVQSISDHIADLSNPHQVQHSQTGPLGWDQAESSDPAEKKKRIKHVSTEDAEKWNQAAENVVRHYRLVVSSVAQGERKALDLELKLNFNEPIIIGIEVQISKKLLDRLLKGLQEKYQVDDDTLKKWRESVLNTMEENKIKEINEYYLGDLSLIDIWAFVLEATPATPPIVTHRPPTVREELKPVNLELKQIPAPALAVKVDRVAKKLTAILQDRRKEEARVREFVDYTVTFWVAPAKSMKEL
ncbi:MAG: hypothetical protein AB1374_02390 [Bacillota bacterium]